MVLQNKTCDFMRFPTKSANDIVTTADLGTSSKLPSLGAQRGCAQERNVYRLSAHVAMTECLVMGGVHCRRTWKHKFYNQDRFTFSTPKRTH